MSEFMMLDKDAPTTDLGAPATIEAVLNAVVRLSEFDEADIVRLASEGKLRELFPFKPAVSKLPPDFLPEDALVEASPFPLDQEARRALIQSSMPSRDRKKA